LLNDLQNQVIKVLDSKSVSQSAGGIQPIEVICLVRFLLMMIFVQPLINAIPDTPRIGE
jgi:hypothetical protein